jgi:hypothetical protein
MSDWKTRLTEHLEPALACADPRPTISAYHDMPCAIFQYAPEAEFDLRHELYLLRRRLETNHGKRITTISLAECLRVALESVYPIAELIRGERLSGTAALIDTIHEILSHGAPLPEIVSSAIPTGGDPKQDIFFLVRAGALFPFYRTSALLEQLMGMVRIPGVLFYPGALEGAAGLRFMGVRDAEHNYRPRIF